MQGSAVRPRTGIDVGAELNSSLERVWALTQDPSKHARWDVRFGRITPTGAGTFCYRRFGVGGTGEHSGDRRATDGSATSALRFACAHPLSPIEEGSGYWRYTPREDGGVTFATWYDYRSRYPRIDRFFRPLMARGTAWSFDRLRLWADRSVPPELSASIALADAAIRAGVVIAATLMTDGPVGLLAAGVLTILALRLPPLPWAPSARRTSWSVGSVR
ncbi:SRPBCC family protein [Branchiibius sp. NY16-3462-2]|uniref:SRPBCC family protein n=1 Tax=Branchiibius sp. NY16-3462-2 TaxID=1807500 RepID=UPI000AC48D35|nr:SRPBCC family protein [Branchiibius sp. NY16-3462-2]